MEELYERGWDVDDLKVDVLYPVRDFASLEDALEAAERDLPRGTPVRWRDAQHRLGGFLTGFPDVGPGIADELPMLVIWPAGATRDERIVDSWTELRRVLLDSVGVHENDETVSGLRRLIGTVENLRDLQFIATDHAGTVTATAWPRQFFPIQQLRWDGFSDGWTGREVAVAGHGHPLLSCDPTVPDYDGAGNRIYRGAVREGIAARRQAEPHQRR